MNPLFLYGLVILAGVGFATVFTVLGLELDYRRFNNQVRREREYFRTINAYPIITQTSRKSKRGKKK